MSVTKTYVLLDTLDVEIPIFQQLPGNQRAPITKIQRHRPFLDIEVSNAQGKGKRLRYKSQCPTPFVDEQVAEPYKIDANAKFSDQERDDCWFRHGVLTTNKENLQKFLEQHPEFEGSEWQSEKVRQKCYRILDRGQEAKVKNEGTRKIIAAGYKIMGMDSLDELQSIMYRINGSFFEAPKSVEECQNALIDWLDQAPTESVDDLMKEDEKLTIDEQTTILIGKLLQAKLLSFDEQENKIVKKDKAGKWISVRDLSNEYSPEVRKTMFSDFLNTDDGKALKNDLEKDLNEYEKKSKSKQNSELKT